MSAVLDPLWPRLEAVLGCVVANLEHYGVPTCRAFVHPGATAPWDVCNVDGEAEGQVWVALARMFPTDPFPAEDTSPQRCHPREYAAELRVGIVRCTPVVDDQGRPPASQDVTTSAAKSTRDLAIIREALLCCYLGDDGDPGSFRLGGWEPLGPSGGCAGGQWTVTIAVPPCPCPQE